MTLKTELAKLQKARTFKTANSAQNSIVSKIEDGTLDTKTEFAQLYDGVFKTVSKKLGYLVDDEVTVYAGDFFDKEFKTKIAIGLAFVPQDKEHTMKLLDTLVEFTNKVRLNFLVKRITVNNEDCWIS